MISSNALCAAIVLLFSVSWLGLIFINESYVFYALMILGVVLFLVRIFRGDD
jgi:hypothetical protein